MTDRGDCAERCPHEPYRDRWCTQMAGHDGDHRSDNRIVGAIVWDGHLVAKASS